MREKNRKPIANNRKRLPQFTTMNVIDGQAGLIICSSLIFYSLTIDNILNIIILLILAGIAIASLTGDNGLFKRAQQAREETEKAQEREGVEIAVASTRMEDVNTLEIKKESLENAIKDYFGENKDFLVTDNKDGSFLINMNDTKRMYYVDDTGIVIPDENILKINTADELKAFREDVKAGNSYEGWYVYLANDISLDINEKWEAIGYISPNYDSKNPEEDINKPFMGIFDGCEHEIDYVLINDGIFGLVIDGKIKNLSLGSNSISVGVGIGGGIAHYMYGTGIISNCKNYANLNVSGGIVGFVVGSVLIENCINYGNLEDAGGGIVGSSNGTDWEQFEDEYNTIINCANYGNVSNDSNNVGGIVGYFKGTISNSFNAGNITMNANRNNTGGIVGVINGNILNCYNIGNVNGYYAAGGIVGLLSKETNNSFKNCYNTGNVQGSGDAGELVGGNQSATQIQNSYTSSDTFGANDLGSAYKEDTNNINNGYPILNWQ